MSHSTSVNKPPSGYRLLAFTPALLVGVCLLVLAIYADHLNSQAQQRELRNSVLHQLSLLRAKIEGNITSNAHLVQGLVSAITVEPDMAQQRFAKLARPLFQNHSQLRNVGAAPGMVIHYVYPLQGNEGAIGLNFRQHPEQLAAVQRARQTGELVLAGPVDLVQGGQGFVARIPVFLEQAGSADKQFWGIVSAVIDVQRFYQNSGLLDDNPELNVALRGKDALGAQGQIFFGDSHIFQQQPVQVEITLPYGSWQMAAIPAGGWSQQAGRNGVFRLGLLAIGMLILIPFIFLGRFLQKNRINETRLRGLFELSPVGIALNDYASGAFLQVNDALLDSTGYQREDFLQLSYWDVTPKEYADKEAQQLQSLETTGRYGPYEKEYIHKDGHRYPVLLNGMVVYDASGKKMIWSIIEDITERKQAEHDLNQFKTTLDHTLDCVFMFDAKTLRFFYVNDGALQQVGYTREQLLNMHPYDIKSELDQQAFHELIAPLRSGQQASLTFETVHQHINGNRIPVEIFLQYISPAGESGRFVAIVRDITERKRVERMKNEFVSTVSHELRTPLTSINGSLGLITGGALGEVPDKIRDILNIAYKNTERLTYLINDLLDMEKLIAGKVHFEIKTQALMPLIKQAIKDNQAYADRFGVHLQLRNRIENIQTKVDNQRLQQVLANLLSNAAKFSPPGSTIDIDVQLHQGWARITVSDQGPGIPAEFHDRLFHKFSQADSSDSRSKGGTGLGLAISKEVVERMQGKIGFESSEGQGARFFIDLPLA